jgi:hypothetical protein
MSMSRVVVVEVRSLGKRIPSAQGQGVITDTWSRGVVEG